MFAVFINADDVLETLSWMCADLSADKLFACFDFKLVQEKTPKTTTRTNSYKPCSVLFFA